MIYAVVYSESAGLITVRRSRHDAELAIAEICADDPGAAERVGLRTIDDEGLPVGCFELGEAVLRRADVTDYYCRLLRGEIRSEEFVRLLAARLMIGGYE